MKYKIREKRVRNQAIAKYHKDNPEYTLSEIGEFFNISRQRVKQILMANKAG